MSPDPLTSVLVVEDDPGVRTTIAMVLRLNGYDVESAVDGFDALDHLRVRVPDILFSDLHMPQMSGFELLSVVRRRFPRVKVIATSGAYDGPRVPSGVLADAFYCKGRSSSLELLETIADVARSVVPPRDTAHDPIWVPRNGRDHNGKPFVVLSCTHCLRAFPFTVTGAPNGELESTPCIYCPHEIFYIIDFSRSVSSPAKRKAWKQQFLRSHRDKIEAQHAADAATLAEVIREMDRPRLTRSVRRLRS